MTWKFSDINYAVVSMEDRRAMLLQYAEFLNTLPADAMVKITVYNRKLDLKEFRHSLMLPAREDALNTYRGEYNRMLQTKAEATQNMMRERYITVSLNRKTIEEVRASFHRIGTNLITNLGRMGSVVLEMDNTERMKILHDFFRPEGEDFNVDLQSLMRRGHNFKDYICPDSIQFKADHFEMDDKVGRVLFLKDYASFIADDMLVKLADVSRNIMLSVDLLPIPTDEAIKEIQNKILAVETDITRWQRKQNENYNFSATIPYEMELMREEAKNFLEELTANDERMMFALLTVVHLSDDLKQLDADTEALRSAAQGCFSNLVPLRWQQEDGLNTVLPYGLRRIHTLRTMGAKSASGLTPFSAQEVREKGGIYYGINAITKNLIICNRKALLNGNAFILGVSGSGKSFIAKEELAFTAMATNDDIIVVDPEREYGSLIQALGGEVIRFAPDSKNHINALDMSKDYGDGDNPLALKSSFVMSIYENLNNNTGIESGANSLVDRCVKNVYKDYLIQEVNEPPTLGDLRKELMKQEESLAKKIALDLEIFTEGSLNVFSNQTNVDLNNRIICFDILDLGKQLKTIGLLIMLDTILNRVMENRKAGKRTWVYIDEIYLFFANEYSSSFLSESWKRFRKYGALATGITQNVTECLESSTARTMFSNSEFLILLNQAPPDREELARMFHISEMQMGHITNTQAGRGLLKIKDSLVPFVNEFPRSTELYKLMTTKPEDK